MKRPILVTSSFLIISTIYTFSLFSWVSLQALSHLLQRWSHESEMTVYLRPEVKNSEINQLKQQLSPYLNQIKLQFQSPDEIRNHIQKIMPQSEFDFSQNDELASIIPPHIIITTTTSSLFGSSLFSLFEDIKTKINNLPYVESASYGKSWLDKYSLALGSFKKGALGFLAILSLTVVLAIGNTIRSYINSCRDEIEILELVGATPRMIRKPFLLKGALLSASAMFFALTLVSITIFFFKTNVSSFLPFLSLESGLYQLSFPEWISGLFGAVLVGLLGSYFCLIEINTGWAASESGQHE